MIQLLCEELAQKIRASGLVYLAGGLAVAWPYNDKSKKKKAVFWNYRTEEHENLTPDEQKFAITYFEENSTQIQPTPIQEYVTTLTLVGWVNTRKGVKTPFLIQDLQQLFKAPFNTASFSNVKVRFTELLPESTSLFSKYDYDNAVKKYLQKPYDAFGLRLTVAYNICVPADYERPRQFDDSFSRQMS